MQPPTLPMPPDHCDLKPDPVRPGTVRCLHCGRAFPTRFQNVIVACHASHGHRNAAHPASLAAACQTCDRLGQVDGSPICGLDLPEANRRKLAGKESCAKAWLKRRYRERLEVVGGECDKWQEWLALHPVKDNTMKPEGHVVESPRTVSHGGPGTELKKLLGRFGIRAGDCRCNRRALLMDQEGPDWCEANIELIVDWLAEAAAARKLPFARLAGRILVRTAVRAARQRVRAVARMAGSPPGQE